MAITAAMRTEVTKLYVALFGRAPDSDGLGYWVSQVDGGKTIAQVAQDMYNTTPARTTYPLYLTNTEIVTAFYTNVLGRAPDTDGAAYWAAQLGTKTAGQVISDMITAVTNYTGTTDTAAVNSKTLFANKAAVAEYYAVTLQGNASGATSAISGVTATTDVSTDAAKAAVVTSSGAVSGTTFTLTTAADTGSSVTGGTGSDTFNGVIGTDMTAANGTTFNSGDALTGGSGADTLNISISGTNTASRTTAATTLTGIETIKVSNYETHATFNSTIDLANATGVSTIALTSSDAAGDTYFTSVQNLVAAEMGNGSGDLSITYADAVVTGSSDTQNLTVSGITAGTFTAAATATGGVETLAITSSGSAANVLTAITGATSLKTITVAGSQAITLGTLDSAVTTLNASSNTGGVTATLGADSTVTGSAGNDVITTIQVTNGSVNAGSGTDSLVLTADAYVSDSVEGGLYTGFETLNVKLSETITAVAADWTDRSQDVSLVSGITKVAVSGALTSTASNGGGGSENDNTGNGTITAALSGLSASVTDLTISGLSYTDTDATTAADDDIVLTVSAARTTDTSADVLAVTLGTSSANAGNVASGTDAMTMSLTLANEETLTLTSQGAANYITTLTANDLTSLTVAGSKSLTVTTIASNANMATLNAASFTGSLEIGTNNSAVASTITAGSGNDSIDGGSGNDSMIGGSGNDTLDGAAGKDTIDGGAGADSITGGAGIDSLSGGEGNDEFYVSATTTEFTGLTTAEVVSGGSGTDTLKFAAAALTLAATDLTGLSGIEIVQDLNTTLATGITLTDAVFTANGATTLTLDVDTMTTGVLTVSASGLTAANSVVVDADANGFNSSSTITLGAGNDTVLMDNDNLDSTVIIAGSGTDTLKLSTGGTATVASTTTGIENITFVDVAGAYDVITSQNNIASGATMTVDGSNLTTGTVYFSAAAESDGGKVSVTGGSGADSLLGGSGNDTITGNDGVDTIQGGAGIDSLSGGAGVDTFVVATTGTGFTGLTSAEVVSGGAGNDVLQFDAGAVSVNSTDLTGLSSIETIELLSTTQTGGVTLTDAVFTANGLATLTIDADTATTGILTISAGNLSAANGVVVLLNGDNADANESITLGAGNDTVKAEVAALNGTTTIGFGSGTDTLTIEDAGGETSLSLAGTVTGFETINFSADDDYTVVMADASVASGVTVTVDATVITTAAKRLSFDGSLEATGKFIITGGVGNDSLVAGMAADTINGGNGNDTINGGSGADVLTGGSGLDVFTFGGAAQSNSSATDTVADFVSTSDVLRFTLDYSGLSTAQTVNAQFLSNSASGYDGVTNAQAALSGERGQTLLDTTNGHLYVNVDNNNLLTSLDYKVAMTGLTGSSVVAADLQYVITGGTSDDTITGGSGSDTIVDSAGADSVNGGQGVDTISVSTGADNVVYNTTTAGGLSVITLTNVGTAADDFTATAGTTVDSVTTFTTTSDNIAIIGSLLTAINLDGTATSTAGTLLDNGNIDFNAAQVFLFNTADDLVGDNFGDVSDIATTWNTTNSGTPANSAANDEVLFAIGNNSGTEYGLYYFKDVDGNGDISAGDQIALLAIIGVAADASLVAGDVVFA